MNRNGFMSKYYPLKSSEHHPLWLKYPLILVGLYLLFTILSYGKFILMPIAYAAFFAMLINPMIDWFEKRKLGRASGIILSLLLVLIVLTGVISLISTQFIQFAEQIPEVNEKLKSVMAGAIQFMEEQIGISQEQQSEYLEKGVNNLIDQSGDYVSSVVSATTNAFTVMSLLPVFIFFMLYYREMYQTFFREILAKKRSEEMVDTLLNNVRSVTQNYLVGMLTVVGIMALLNTTGLLLIGLEHAFFFGVFASLLAIIPYIGIIIGSIPPLLYAFLLGDSLLQPVLVLAVFGGVQFLEGNFITPRIVGSKVSINPFMALLALIIGGELWGVSGMILFVPLVGILRVVFKEIDGLKPFGTLLGGSSPYGE